MSAKRGMANNVPAIHWFIVVTVTCCHSNICDIPWGMHPLRIYCVILPECGSLCIMHIPQVILAIYLSLGLECIKLSKKTCEDFLIVE